MRFDEDADDTGDVGELRLSAPAGSNSAHASSSIISGTTPVMPAQQSTTCNQGITRMLPGPCVTVGAPPSGGIDTRT